MITACRSCEGTDLVEVLDLGMQHLADYRNDDTRPPRFPLRLLLCQGCMLAQLDTTVPRELMYHDGYGFRSGTNETIRANLADVVKHGLAFVPEPKRWLDIASNDGTLLSYVPKTVSRVGVDPVAKFADEARQHADEIVPDYFRTTQFGPGTFDVISSVSMFYDLDDPNEFVAGVARILKPGGVWVIQQNHLGAMLANTAFDNICHEHITYFSVTSLRPLLEWHGLEINDIAFDPINGGCFRTVVSHKGSHQPAGQVKPEWVPEVFDDFATRARSRIAELADLVERIYARGQSCFIYAASTRGAVIWQAAGITPEWVPYAVERQPEKVGKVFSALGIPIIGEDEARKIRPDYMLVGPYWLRDGIIMREREYLEAGGHLLFPLPVVDEVAL